MAPSFPWYDSTWLTFFVRSKAYIQTHCPEKLAAFLSAIDPLRTRADFTVIKIDRILDESTLKEARSVINKLTPNDRELDELSQFGRIVVQDHPFFSELQSSLCDRVSSLVKEPVEPHYNFLSLYLAFGRCEVHMDAPEAKWTLDCCLEQSEPWPIHFSQVQPWPENFRQQKADWQEDILDNPNNCFSEFSLKEQEALIFSGSSQWHYRDQIPRSSEQSFCHLVFFHYIPRGTLNVVNPDNWPEMFDIPELAPLLVQNDS